MKISDLVKVSGFSKAEFLERIEKEITIYDNQLLNISHKIKKNFKDVNKVPYLQKVLISVKTPDDLEVYKKLAELDYKNKYLFLVEKKLNLEITQKNSFLEGLRENQNQYFFDISNLNHSKENVKKVFGSTLQVNKNRTFEDIKRSKAIEKKKEIKK
ncbi:hypothetical protein SCORR_v1c10160 (plasmid) [Spiroplasma corruscae]|uniref:Uncharacterized protein n=1 Tax=Spiroplasma corruscae TaxID=216934 RepID=A0A222EQH9_9MOLU|nr:hypothetical protein [Spiroplasma corruscae]ASP28788.1 hypothetical protein SCORR_v1c10160 [Spiroplasma corruscae]